MQNSTLLSILQGSRLAQGTRLAALGAATACTMVLSGCGTISLSNTATTTVTNATFQGKMFGGQQPVSGATVQLYAATQTSYGQAATALISSAVTTDANGNFTITGTYTCPYASTAVYLLGTGGNSGAGTNANLAMMSALGPCGNLTSSTFINVNELTTVASAYALSGFMSSPTQLSTSPTNTTGLSNAMATVNKLVNISTGQMPGNTLPSGATEPVAELNTLADILASCVNSNGVGGSSTNCANLFTAATPPGGTAPTDTLTAALNIAKNPGTNVPALYALTLSQAPFNPTLSTAPTDFTVALKYRPTGIFNSPSASAVDASGNLWVTNSASNNIAVLNATTGTPTLYSGGGLNAPSAIAFDAYGDAWVPNKGNSTLSVFTSAGSGTAALTSGLNSPSGVAIDGQGLIWVTNSGSNNVAQVTASRLSVTGFTTLSTSGTGPVGVAINPR